MMKRKYTYEVNGLYTDVYYEDETVEKIFLPLLKKWSSLHDLLGRRILIFLSAPPGTGKTTTVQFLEYLSRKENGVEEIQSIGLDGFHYHQDYILTHDADINGKKIPMKEIKGCPETFDIDKLKLKIKNLKEGPTKWPIYDRTIHDVQEDVIDVQKQIVLIEGNWLLLKEHPWDELMKECDDSVFISAEESDLRERLINRKIKGGLTEKEAVTFYEKSDSKNIHRLMNAHWTANETLIMKKDGRYIREERGKFS